MSPEKRRIATWKKNRTAPEWYSFSETPIAPLQQPKHKSKRTTSNVKNK
jgi:hypothetical protein